MSAKAIPWFLVVMVMMLSVPVAGLAQETFSAVHGVHFDVRYSRGVGEAEAQDALTFLQADYDSLKNMLGLEVRDKKEVRLYDSPGHYRAEAGAGTEVLSAMYVHGILYVLVTAPAPGVQRAMRYQMARIFLASAAQRSCPSWLVESFAIYHSGLIVDLTPPGAVTVSSFADLSQDLAEAKVPSERDDINYVLGQTMQFFVDRYGDKKALSVFKQCDGSLATEKVFKKVFGDDFEVIEKAWAKYVAVKPRKLK